MLAPEAERVLQRRGGGGRGGGEQNFVPPTHGVMSRVDEPDHKKYRCGDDTRTRRFVRGSQSSPNTENTGAPMLEDTL